MKHFSFYCALIALVGTTIHAENFFIKPFGFGEKFTINIDSSKKVTDLKELVFKKTKIPRNRFYLYSEEKAKDMFDGHYLKRYIETGNKKSDVMLYIKTFKIDKHPSFEEMEKTFIAIGKKRTDLETLEKLKFKLKQELTKDKATQETITDKDYKLLAQSYFDSKEFYIENFIEKIELREKEIKNAVKNFVEFLKRKAQEVKKIMGEVVNKADEMRRDF